MTAEPMIPENPLDFIRVCVRDRKIYWTYHVNMRLKGRFIPRQAILDSNSCYEIIEEYPRDKYFPSYLVYSQHEGRVFHILFAVDLRGDNVRIITAYPPNAVEWEADLKTRRQSP